MKRNFSFHVAPRWSSGSPAMVDIATAMKVAADELDCGHGAAQGIYGEEAKLKYELCGLRGIVYITYEKRGHMWVQDVLTDELFCVKLSEWGGPGWTDWNKKSYADMQEYLYTKDDRPNYMIQLTA